MTYKLKPCPFCKKPISNISSRGNILPPDKYKSRKACSECFELARLGGRVIEMPVLNTAIDAWNYGRIGK